MWNLLVFFLVLRQMQNPDMIRLGCWRWRYSFEVVGILLRHPGVQFN